MRNECKRCGVGRRARWDAWIFTRGMCGRCYNLLHSFNFDEAAVSAHETLQELKQEIRMPAKKKPKITNTNDLRSMLLETIDDVRSGSIDPKQARTIAALATTVLHSAKLDLDFMRFDAENDNLQKPQKSALTLVAS